MHKGCVMEVRKNTMVIMTDDCQFTEIKRKGQAEVGTEIQFHSREMVKPRVRQIQPWMLMAASILLVVVTSLYGMNLWQMNYQVHALLTVDINPSIQMEVNANNKVIKVTPLNEEAKTLPLQELKNQSVELALEELVKASKEQGYLHFEDENYILVARVLLKEKKNNVTGLETLIEVGKENIEQRAMEQGARISVVTIEAEEESLIKATEDKVSVGRLKMYERVKAATAEDLNMEEMKEQSIGQMMKQIEKAHPVFEQHPSNRDQDQKSKEHPVFEEHPSNQKKNNEQEKLNEHPVFNEHPRDKEKEKEKEKDDEKPNNQKKDNQQEKIDGRSNQSEKDQQGEKIKQNEKQNEKQKENTKKHPVFDQQPGSRSQGRQQSREVLPPGQSKRIYSLTL